MSNTDISPVLVIFQFDRELCKRFNNDVVRQKSVMKSYGHGHSAGFADEVVYLDGDWKRNMTVGFLHFDSAVAAQRWINSDPIFRQHDWLDDVEIWIVPLCMEMKQWKYLQLSLFNLVNEKNFKDRYLPKFEESVSNFGGVPFISSTSYIEVLRGLKGTDYFIISEWPDEDTFLNWNQSHEAEELRNIQDTFSKSSTILAMIRQNY
ncbi:hypothetical protein MN116_003639 [Schistosoma mekongi]|uniref:Uncharacterized protein n=1 Tax=Schistosoma mekongi TaxID=38744 RepID=A0AAE1ZEJ1_SCHME|nr:hypothetical protein MN116_003639 [Schistosoma mekongi]